jgi:hypothetical protein
MNDKEYIYVLEFSDLGWTDILGFYRNLSDARKEMQKMINEAKKHDGWVNKKDYEGKRGGNGKIVEPTKYEQEMRKELVLIADVFQWAKVSYEYDEWDIQGNELRIRQVELQ